MLRTVACACVVWTVGAGWADRQLQGQVERALSPEEARARLGDRLETCLELGRRLLAGLDEDSSDRGGGGSVANLVVMQVLFVDDDEESAKLWVWNNPGPNPAGIQPLTNGIPVVDSGGSPLLLPGTDTSMVTYKIDPSTLPEMVEFEVLGASSSATDMLYEIRSQPFANPASVTCRAGLRDPTSGKCSVVFDIQNPDPPQWYTLSYGGISDDPDAKYANPLHPDLPGRSTGSIPGFEGGSHCFQLTGWSNVDGSDYLGDPVDSCCDIECKDLPCDAPYNLKTCQSAFGAGEADNKALLSWTNGEGNYTFISVTLDGQVLPALSGQATETLLEGLSAGDHEAIVEAECGDAGKSTPSAISFPVVSTAPEGTAPESVACKFVAANFSRISVTWKNASSPTHTEVYIVDPQGGLELVHTVAGQATGANLDGTARDDRVGLRSFYTAAGACFSSDLVVCTPALPPGFKYLTGDCDGNGSLNLTDAIFGLNHLFRGGDAAPCPAGCDANDDVRVDLADSIYTLNHLFLSGPAPGGSYPACDEAWADSAVPCPRSTCFR